MEGLNRGNSRNGKRSKTVLTDAAGAVEIEVPRDREGTFAPVIARLAPGPAVRCRHGRAEPVQPRADQRGDLRPLRRGLRRERVQGHDHADHRHGAGGDGGVVAWATGAGLCGDPRRRDRSSWSVTGRSDRSRSTRPNRRRRRLTHGHPGDECRRRRRGVREVLDGRAHRHQEPWLLGA